MYNAFFRLIELGKLQLKTELKDKRDYLVNAAVRKVKNKSGVIETRVFTCPECSEEFCNGKFDNAYSIESLMRSVFFLILRTKLLRI